MTQFKLGATLGLTALLLGGCAAGVTEQKVRDMINSEIARVTTRAESEQQELRRKVDSLTTQLTETRAQLVASDNKLAEQQTRMAEQTGERIDAVEQGAADERGKLRQAMRELILQNANALDDLRKALADYTARNDAALASMDARQTRALTDADERLTATIDEQDQLLNSRLDLLRTEALDLASRTESLAGTLRALLHRQRDVLAEQMQSIAALSGEFDELLGDEAKSGYEQAARLFNKALESHRRALQTDDLDLLREALGHYEDGLVLNPKYIAAHFNAASILLELNQPARAVPYLRRVVELDPSGELGRRAETTLSKIDGL